MGHSTNNKGEVIVLESAVKMNMSYPPFFPGIDDLRVDGVLGNIALDTEIVSRRFEGTLVIVSDMSTNLLHPVSKHPSASNNLSNAPHGLCITADHTDRSHVVQTALGSNCLATNTTFGEMNVLWQVFVQMMADH